MYKNGLNLAVAVNVFGEDPAQREKCGGDRYTRVVYNTLHPLFNEEFRSDLRMDTQAFEYLKSKRAVFELRHYFASPDATPVREDLSAASSEVDYGRDYLVLGCARVPLIALLTRSSGVEEEVAVLDEHNQIMGFLRVALCLSHRGSQPATTSFDRPREDVGPKGETLMTKSVRYKTEVEEGAYGGVAGPYVLGLGFSELIQTATERDVEGERLEFLYLKYNLDGQNFQTKFMGGADKCQRLPLNYLVYPIRLCQFLEIDVGSLGDMSKPLEIQLWSKKDRNRYVVLEK